MLILFEFKDTISSFATSLKCGLIELTQDRKSVKLPCRVLINILNCISRISKHKASNFNFKFRILRYFCYNYRNKLYSAVLMDSLDRYASIPYEILSHTGNNQVAANLLDSIEENSLFFSREWEGATYLNR